MEDNRYLFRGKRKDNDEWIRGNYVSGIFFEGEEKRNIPYIMTGDFIDYDCFEDFTDDYGYYEVIPETVGQSTGLKDKNGTLIFEGDIFHMGDPEITYKVVWFDSGLIGKQMQSYGSYAGISAHTKHIEIINNAHDPQGAERGTE